MRFLSLRYDAGQLKIMCVGGPNVRKDYHIDEGEEVMNYRFINPLSPKYQNSNSHLLSLYISYKSSNEKLLKYQLIMSCVIISLTLITNLFHKTLISQGEF